MLGERFPCQYRLIRLLNSIMLGAARRLDAPERTRKEHVLAGYGPSRRLKLIVVALWLVVLLGVLHLVVFVLHGPIVR
jgi:hypothetical protein